MENVNFNLEVMGEKVLVETTMTILMEMKGLSLREKAINLVIESIKVGEIFTDDGELQNGK